MKRMTQLIVLVTLAFFGTRPASGQQIGKYVPIPAGSDADHAMTEINAEADPAKKLALIDKFSSTLGRGRHGDCGRRSLRKLLHWAKKL